MAATLSSVTLQVGKHLCTYTLHQTTGATAAGRRHRQRDAIAAGLDRQPALLDTDVFPSRVGRSGRGPRSWWCPPARPALSRAAEAGGAPLPFAAAGDSVDLNLTGFDAQVRATSRSFPSLNSDGHQARVT